MGDQADGVNDRIPPISAMPRQVCHPRQVTFLIYPEFQLLDAAGPIAAFEIAERYRPSSYALRVVAVEPGLVASSSGACLHAMAPRIGAAAPNACGALLARARQSSVRAQAQDELSAIEHNESQQPENGT